MTTIAQPRGNRENACTHARLIRAWRRVDYVMIQIAILRRGRGLEEVRQHHVLRGK